MNTALPGKEPVFLLPGVPGNGPITHSRGKLFACRLRRQNRASALFGHLVFGRWWIRSCAYRNRSNSHRMNRFLVDLPRPVAHRDGHVRLLHSAGSNPLRIRRLVGKDEEKFCQQATDAISYSSRYPIPLEQTDPLSVTPYFVRVIKTEN